MAPDELLDRWPEAERILDALLDLPADERRARALDACAGDTSLQPLLERLLGQVDSDAAVPSLPPELLSESIGVPHDAPSAGGRIGPYRLLKELGRGGSGCVFHAVREDGVVAPPIALKLLHRGARSPHVLKRFERERDILSRLEHPHIGRLHGGGVTDDGTPYLAMELVQGLPLDRYADVNRLDLDARLGLFRDVCRAVEYAHAHLIVHRDLKPANVLVDTFGAVKLLDFGIAKWLDEMEAEASLTETAHRVLTPAFAAPEQFRGEPTTVATDVYQLGLLLYTLLTGRSAYATGAVGPALYRAVLDMDPPRPSQTVLAVRPSASETDPASDSPLLAPGTTSQALARRLAGDLDAIVLQALRKEPSDRYASVEALRRDIDDYLGHRPISARHASVGSRLKKYVRRHRVSVAAATAASLALVAGLAATAWQASVAAEETRKAVEVKEFLLNLFEMSAPDASPASAVTARALLDNGAARVQELQAQPALQAEMLGTVGEAYFRLGVYDRAREVFERALALNRTIYGRWHSNVADAASRLGESARMLGRLDDAEALQREALAIRRALLGNADPLVARSLNDLGNILLARGDLEPSETFLRDALAIAERDGRDRRVLAAILNNLGFALERQRKFQEAERRYRESFAVKREVFGDTHPRVSTAMHNLARLLAARGDFAAAEPLTREALALRERQLGGDHPDVALTVFNLAQIVRRRGDAAQAEALYTRALGIQRRRLGPGHQQVAWTLTDLADMRRLQGAAREAERLFHEALAILEPSDPDHFRTAAALFGLGQLHAAGGNPDDARRALARALEIRVKAFGANDPRTVEVRRALDTLPPARR